MTQLEGNPKHMAAKTSTENPTNRKKPADFQVKASQRKTMQVDLVGVTYQIRIPKSYAMLRFAALSQNTDDMDMSAMVEAMNAWIKQAFGKEGTEHVHERLDDPDDDLDIDHIMQLMEAVTEASAPGNPTT